MNALGSFAAQEPRQQLSDKTDRVRPIKPLPTDRISPSNQLRILRAWGRQSNRGSRAVTVNEVAHAVRMAASTVAMTNPFFASTGLLQRLAVGTYMPCREVISYAGDEDGSGSAADVLRPVLCQTWFGRTLIEKLSTVGSIPEDEAILLLEQTAASSLEYRKPIEFLIDFLVAGHLLERIDGNVRLVGERTPTVAVDKVINGNQIQVAVHVDTRDLIDWSAERIAALFDGLAVLISAK